MTKYEWENELAKNLKRLPEAESARILDYYNELFLDKADTGLSEKEIIKSFGNPFDVAYKVVYGFEEEGGIKMQEQPQQDYSPMSKLNEPIGTSTTDIPNYQPAPATTNHQPPMNSLVDAQDDRNKEAHTAYYQQPTSKKKKRTGGIIARIIFFIPFFVIFITLWTLVISLIASGIGASIGGIGIAVLSLFLISSQGVPAVAAIGLGLVSSGIGLLLIVFVRAIFKGTLRMTQKYFYIGKHKTAKRSGE